MSSQERPCSLESLLAHSGIKMWIRILNILLMPKVMLQCLDIIVSYFLHFLFTKD